ncbi:leucine-rich repeat domain-containing protein [Spirosoma sp. KCTC 42546]|uniref:leucine-rich repeat domain-containing protein n=1 Tax=Spirosoma sp. KCTC 42546 TaxID=2520506 RepID=UPI00115AF0EF|nr:leucine-rich repeat domain-containing protein [Spirosoma sp. KCTC 42546]QDK82771.1 leucine-rich repeat domain-containing protein [Spirosoma sp. KCTC 42546]
MAIRSLLLSLALTGILGYCFTVGLTDPNSLFKKIPDWAGIALFLGCGLLYLLATWWAFKGFSVHKLSALVSMGFCAVGLGIYALVFVMELGHSRARPGQYDYDFTTLSVSDKAIVAQIAHDAGLSLEDAVFTEHWTMDKAAKSSSVTNTFGICVQKGKVVALNLSNHPVRNLALLAKLPDLGDLYLRNCALSDMSDLRSTKLDRLDVSDNQIIDLNTLHGCPTIQWLTAENNQLTSTDGIDQFKQLVSSDFTGNPIPKP